MSRNLVTSEVGGTDYRVFEHDLSDLSLSEIQSGVRKSKDFTGYFTIPKFRELCKISPSEFGLPDVRRAFNECFHGGFGFDREWSHPAVYHAARETGSFEMKTLETNQLFPLFKHNYEEMVRRVMSGETLDMPVQKAIPAKIEIPLTPEQEEASRAKALAVLAELKGAFK